MKYFLFFFLYTSTVFAGNGWIGSGGGLFKDAKNPWWLHNTTEIKYCILFDTHSMTTTQATAEDLTKDMFNNWLNEWKYFFKKKNKLIKLGNQKLTKILCDGSEDISFHFGWDSLTTEQKEYIKNAKSKKSLVGLTARTSYDSKNLRGKGFIYIASDVGQDKFDLGKDYYEEPWRHDFLLSMLLAHEIAHTFGVQHADQFEGLMKEDIFDLILQKWYVKLLEPVLDTQLDFKYFSRLEQFSTEVGGLSKEVIDFFTVSPKSQLLLSRVGATKNYVIHEETAFGIKRLTHRFTFNQSSTEYGWDNTVITVYLPEEQNVYPANFSETNRDYIFTNASEKLMGTLEDLRSGDKKDVLIIGNSEKLTLHHLKAGRMIEAEFHSNFYQLKTGAKLLNQKRVN